MIVRTGSSAFVEIVRFWPDRIFETFRTWTRTQTNRCHTYPLNTDYLWLWPKLGVRGCISTWILWYQSWLRWRLKSPEKIDNTGGDIFIFGHSIFLITDLQHYFRCLPYRLTRVPCVLQKLLKLLFVWWPDVLRTP